MLLNVEMISLFFGWLITTTKTNDDEVVSGLFDGKATRGQRRWFKKEKKLPHKGYLPSPGGMPPWMAAEEDCDERWGTRKGKNGYNIPRTYPHYEKLKKRYEEVHQRPMGSTIPLFFALGWVAEERFGEDAVDWATFACWKANNHDGPFEEMQERETRVASDDLARIIAGKSKVRGRPSRDKRQTETIQSSVSENSLPPLNKQDSSSGPDIQVGGAEVWHGQEAWHGEKLKVPIRPWSTKRKGPVTTPTTGDGQRMLPPKKRGGAAFVYVEKKGGGKGVGSDLGFTIAARRGKPGELFRSIGSAL